LIMHQCKHLSEAYVNELISFGSVYLSVPNSKSILQSPKGSPGKRVDGMSKVARVLCTKTTVPKGSYCRVHVNPRRYELAHSVDWSKRIFTGGFTDYVFVNKISGLPTVPTVDNFRENALSQVEQTLGLPDCSLFVTSRIDACTSGISIFAKTSAASSTLNGQMSARTVTKVYRALVRKPVPCGPRKHLHCSRADSSKHESARPGLLRALRPAHEAALASKAAAVDEADGTRWQLAELIVLSCEPLRRGADFSAESMAYLRRQPSSYASASVSGAQRRQERRGEDEEEEEVLFEVRLQLVTGRTHQIRLQLAAEGAAVLGDCRYEPAEGLLNLLYDHPAPGGGGGEVGTVRAAEEESGLQVGDGSDLFGPEPRAIALHCDEMHFPASFFRGRSGLCTLHLDSLSIEEEEEGSEEGRARTRIVAGRPPWRIS
jgi:23S rRNA-/tRNA-specific pseudouridylate synthase